MYLKLLQSLLLYRKGIKNFCRNELRYGHNQVLTIPAEYAVGGKSMELWEDKIDPELKVYSRSNLNGILIRNV